MGEWQLDAKHLKNYPHFDLPISATAAKALALDPDRVAKHTFYPFLLYSQHWNRYAQKGETGKTKDRPIRYAARRDAYIFSRYRHALAERYEIAITEAGITDSVLAYRRIPKPGSVGGKCNIDFAYDAVQEIRRQGNCCVAALDISQFFESLDHARLKSIWCRLLGVDRLPADHFQVFKAITRYAVVDKKTVYQRLGHFGVKRTTRQGQQIEGYLTPFKQIPKRLCSGKEFQEKIAGQGEDESIIEVNLNSFGIPQGAPISDLLANIYLLDFDIEVARWMAERGGTYYRYSDDILLIAPGDGSVGQDLGRRVRDLMPTFGEQLVIKESKTAVYAFETTGPDQHFRHIEGEQGRNGLEYLGFRYDGRQVYLRDNTLANHRRKVVLGARREANKAARRYPDKNANEISAIVDHDRFVTQFGRVEDFEQKQRKYNSWTFWTYAKRATKIFGALGKRILRQLRDHRKFIRETLDDEIRRAVSLRERRKELEASE